METCPEDEFFRDRRLRFKETLVIDGGWLSIRMSEGASQLVIGLDITTNRLFGPSPRTRTYVCVWEIAMGHVKTLTTPLESRALLAVVDAFRIHFTDISNAPADEFSVPLDPDCE